MEVLQIVINSTKFYFHELAWARYAGGQRADTARSVDFDYISMNQPTLTTSEKLVNWTYNLGHISKVGAESAGIFFAGMYDYAVNGTVGAVGAAQNAVGYVSAPPPATGTATPAPGSPAPALTQ
jgi:hypothetical protein